MKTPYLLIPVLCISLMVGACTNDEGETEFDHISPETDEAIHPTFGSDIEN